MTASAVDGVSVVVLAWRAVRPSCGRCIYAVVTKLVHIDVAAAVEQRACGGDPQAQAEIYDAIAPATFTLIRRIVGDRTLAEDLFQDALMSVYQGLGYFRGVHRLEPG